MTGLLELLISTVALLVLCDASFEWVLQTIWNILMNNHVHGTLKICCSFLEISPKVIFVESDPWTCIVYKLGFSYVNDILWMIFFDSFLRSDWIQKKKFGGERYCLVFMSSSMVPWKDCGKVQTFQKIENGTLWAESSAGIAWQRPINVSVGMHFKQSFFVCLLRKKQRIHN